MFNYINKSLTDDKQTYNVDKKQIDTINPAHYRDGKIEVIDYIEDKQLGYCLGNAVKYISRAGKKHEQGMTDKEKAIDDLKKAKWYIERRIMELKKGISNERNDI